jgi:TRAP-type mannitol/chloroaromatic compound transport system substrate-binding protein
MSAANADFRRLYDSYTAFQREAVGWMRFTENAFDHFMAEALRPRPAGGGQQRRPS